MTTVRTTIAATLLVVLGGCYHYVPTDPSTVPAGTKIQAQLTPRGADEMTRFYGPGTTTVEGPLASWSMEGLSILREVSLHQPGFMPTTLTDTLHLDPTMVAGIGVQTLNGKKTAVVSAGILAFGVASIFAARIFGGTQDPPGEGDGGPPPDDLLFFSIPIGFP